MPARVDVPASGKPFTVPDLGLEMRPIPAGTFRMGSPAGEPGRNPDEGPQTWVAISQGFWLGKTLVTQGQYQDVMGNNPSNFADVGDDAPVEMVVFDDAVAFCQKLTERERAAGRLLKRGYAYMLPTEAQWEYACRAGTTQARYGNLEDIAWYVGNSGDTTHPVGQKQPNAWGLYDMNGNVREWCSDWYGQYPGGNITDPGGPDSGALRVSRGGGWCGTANLCRSAYRGVGAPGDRNLNLGFRVALAPVR
ncbi:MAG TPA: formylglycine-generating enzyme family protein [Opitutaceae bacterium]|nr:formylglycine-generating enzyme family protein [Opitutaceae bacterium]